MKRQIEKKHDDYGKRLISICEQLDRLGFFSVAWAEDGINAILDKLHETEEELARAQNGRDSWREQALVERKSRDEQTMKLAEVSKAFEDFKLQHCSCQLAIKVANQTNAELRSELELLKKCQAKQFDTIAKFQGLTGISYPEGVYKSGSQYVKNRRSKERRGTSTWLIDNSILEAIKALGSVSPRTNAQTEALKLLISSIRMDGSTQFRTPGHDRRAK